jgi:hypothetical protein
MHTCKELKLEKKSAKQDKKQRSSTNFLLFFFFLMLVNLFNTEEDKHLGTDLPLHLAAAQPIKRETHMNSLSYTRFSLTRMDITNLCKQAWTWGNSGAPNFH